MRLQKLVQVDLVGAADHGLRIVDDRHALASGALSEAIGEIVDPRGRADTQAIEFGDLASRRRSDELDLHRLLLGDALEMPQRLRRGWRQLLLGIMSTASEYLATVRARGLRQSRWVC